MNNKIAFVVLNETQYRICSNCDKPMTEGYVVFDGEEYFCSDECRDGWYSKEEWQEVMENDNAYWTEFY